MPARVAIQYNSSAAQLLALTVSPVNPANAAIGVVTSGGAASLSLYTSGGTAVTSYTGLSVTWDSTNRRLYRNGTFPAASFPLGLGYIAEWVFTVGDTGYTAPEPQQTVRTVFDVLYSLVRPILTPAEVWGVQPRLQQHQFTDSATEQQGFIDRAWDELYLDVLAALQDTPHSLIDSLQLKEPHRLLTLSHSFEAIQRDVEQAKAASYRKRYATTIAKVLALAPRDPGAQTGIPSDTGVSGVGSVFR